MKTVFSTTSEVAHVFANSCGQNRRARCRAVFCEYDTAYDYGYHFPICGFVRAAVNGEDGQSRYVVFFNSREYSRTTTKHKSEFSGAFYGTQYEVFRFPLPSRWSARDGLTPELAEDALAYYAKTVADLTEKAKRARTWGDSYRQQASEMLAEWRNFCDAFGLARSAETTVEGLMEVAAEAKANREKAEREKAIRAAIANAEKMRDQFAAFRAGGMRGLYGGEFHAVIAEAYELPEEVRGFTAALALTTGESGEREIVTSRGATVSEGDFRAAYAAILARPDSIVGRHVGPFVVESVHPEGDRGYVRIGCHAVPMVEIHRIAAILNGSETPWVDRVSDMIANLVRKAKKQGKSKKAA